MRWQHLFPSGTTVHWDPMKPPLYKHGIWSHSLLPPGISDVPLFERLVIVDSPPAFGKKNTDFHVPSSIIYQQSWKKNSVCRISRIMSYFLKSSWHPNGSKCCSINNTRSLLQWAKGSGKMQLLNPWFKYKWKTIYIPTEMSNVYSQGSQVTL